MHELRLVAVSEDGSYAVLVVPGRSGRFALPIDERLVAVARGQFSRLAQYEIEVENPLRPKEIQDRIRAGETAEDIADAAGLPVDRIRRFEGPVLAERGYRAQEAQRATVRGRADSGPGQRLGEVVAERLAAAGVDAEEAEWDSRKRPDGNWQVQLAYTVAGRMHLAEWVYDARTKHVIPDGEEAQRLSLGEADLPVFLSGGRPAATATVTPIGSRSGAPAQAHAQARAAPPRPAPAAPRPAAAPPVPARAPAPSRAEAGPDEAASVVGAAAGAVGAAAEAEPADDEASEPAAAARDSEPGQSPARRASGGRSRRSSVPSWDEIILGSSRPTD